MSNNLALFVTHHVFLTDDQIAEVASGGSLTVLGHCVPVWVNAKTGRTTEPAKELFCLYDISVSSEGSGEVDHVAGRGYRVSVPWASRWSPPPEIDFDEISAWGEEERSRFLREREEWWFFNPKPMGLDDLRGGYLRFEVKKQGVKAGRKSYSVQHIVEISKDQDIRSSLTS